MTLEELKEEAGKLGYTLQRKAVSPGRPLHCTCGSKSVWRFGHRYTDDFYIQCRKCKKKGPVINMHMMPVTRVSDLQRASCDAWNEMIKKEIKNDQT